MRRAPLPARIAGAFADLVRWGEPWDVEDDEDPLLDRPATIEACSILG